MYGNNDWRDYLAHSWGKKPEQKAREKAYNHEYYQQHKDKWKSYKSQISKGVSSSDKDDWYSKYRSEQDRIRRRNPDYEEPEDWEDLKTELIEMGYDVDDTMAKHMYAQYKKNVADENRHELSSEGVRSEMRWKNYSDKTGDTHMNASTRVEKQNERRTNLGTENARADMRWKNYVDKTGDRHMDANKRHKKK